MRIWVDGDACPKPVKEILFRAAERTQQALILVANRTLLVPRSPWISAIQVPSGFDVADQYIVDQVQSGDLVITADIPLAATVIAKAALVLNPRGERYDQENIREALALRDFMSELRESGVQTGGPAAFSQSDRQSFANALDRLLASCVRSGRL